ncbi:MAG: hypothetical protein UHK54_01475, partial [Acutalibacteraceae bacterium]|nr:hypothetical protein [Acutalibacteraceae bacterium]
MKKSFRKAIALLLALTLVLICFGCSSDSDKNSEVEKVGESAEKDIDKMPIGDLNIISNTIAAGVNHTVALKSDGTVVAVGDNEYGECNVSGWKNIASVSAGFHHTVGLKTDGTVIA